MRVLILGGSGLIGAETARALSARGHAVAGLARDTAVSARRIPAVRWISADLTRLSDKAAWTPLLADVDAVVNCAGALQDGPRDNVRSVQSTAMRALYAAAKDTRIGLIVQVSARTGGSGASTAFMATKSEADAALAASGLAFVILRPAVVIARSAYGGSALLRGLAAFPLVLPLAHAQTPMQFVGIAAVTEAVADALDGAIPPGTDCDVAAAETLTLAEAVAVHRRWLGLPPARVVALPAVVGRLVSAAADGLGRLGWRSPLRSTAMAVAEGGVSGHAAQQGRAHPPLASVLAKNPAGVQDLWFARLYLLKPVVFGTLSLFWIASGAIALIGFERSSAELVASGFGTKAAAVATLATSLADVLLGVGVAIRRHAAGALMGMIALSLAYLATATLLQPGLCSEPLGPLVKVFPSIVLALVALAILEER